LERATFASIAAPAAPHEAANPFAPSSAWPAWLDNPLRAELAELLLFVGAFGLLTRLTARFAPWVGERRYLVLAIAPLLVVGIALALVGAAELAWIALVPAAICALAPALRRASPIAIVVAALPGTFALTPKQLHEAAWNGF